jgi:hypothetical protein
VAQAGGQRVRELLLGCHRGVRQRLTVQIGETRSCHAPHLVKEQGLTGLDPAATIGGCRVGQWRSWERA